MKINYYKQTTNFSCGDAVMKMALEHIGIKKSEKELIKLLKTSNRRGTKRLAIIKLAEKLKLKYYAGGKASLSDLNRYRKEGFVVIIEFYLFTEKIGHFAIFDKSTKDYVHMIDPYFGPKHRLSVSTFRKAWTECGKYDKEPRWFCAINK